MKGIDKLSEALKELEIYIGNDYTIDDYTINDYTINDIMKELEKMAYNNSIQDQIKPFMDYSLDPTRDKTDYIILYQIEQAEKGIILTHTEAKEILNTNRKAQRRRSNE